MTLRYEGGVVVGWKATNPNLRVEVLRAPDNGSGSPDTANEISLAIVAAAPPGGGYVDLSAGVSLTRFHYRVRHVFPGYTAGTATKYIRGHGQEFSQWIFPSESNSISTSALTPNAQWIQSGPPILSPFFTPSQHALFARLSLTTAQTGTSTAGYFEIESSVATTQPIIGVYSVARPQNTTGSVSVATAMFATVRGPGSGGTITDARGLHVQIVGNDPLGTITTAEGIRVALTADSTMTTAYGIRIDNVSGATTNYALYSNAGRVVFNAGAAASSEVWIGHTTAATGSPRLDVVGANEGTFSLADNITNANTKLASVTVRHYTNAEEGVVALHMTMASGSNTVRLGGGTGSFNAATVIEFYTAATTTTLTGTLRLTLNSSGNLILTAPIRLQGYTVATLPAGTQGDSAFVTDALAPTFLTALAGGGTVVTPAFYNGTNWVAF